ncbi:deubiquitinase OTUD6B-like isoform X2 [Corticium candelabrum]|uniref:deubiquitinase OTUD6B-like isoform X2 n=1 Tax=Corticium candelabrum TaxID=121492 RepID=UPI002E26797E|nr:deubiquitinase OTUD6B-like isoform X2 [Corticium candelabrum]
MLKKMDQLVQKHRDEMKELRARIQAMKHGVSKGDKKGKKRVSEETQRLEEDIKARHRKDIEEWQSANVSEMLDENRKEEMAVEHTLSLTRQTRAQRRRDKKDEARRETAIRIAVEEDELAQNSLRRKEWDVLIGLLQVDKLTVQEIPPDGDCLYNAVADQLKLTKRQIHSGSELRRLASNYIQLHRDHFMPFLVHADSGEEFSTDEFANYCDEIATSKAWGGNLEIEALSSVLQCPIEVYQSSGPILKFGEHHNGNVLKLSYHHHDYGLGEHYNSVVAAGVEQK